LECPDVAEVGAGIEARGGTAGELTPAAAQAARGAPPVVAAGEVYGPLQAPVVAPAMGLAEAAMHLGHEVAGRVVDDLVGAQLAQAPHLGLAAAAGDDGGTGHLAQEHAAGAHAAAGAEDQHLL